MAKVDASKDFIRLEKTMDGLGGALRDVTKRLDNLEKGLKKSTKSTKEATNATKKHEDVVRNLRNPIESGTEAWKKYGRQLSVLRSRLLIAAFAFRTVQKTIGSLLELTQKQFISELKLESVLRSTGHAAQMSGTELRNMATEMSKVSLISDDLIIDAAAMQLTFTKIGRDVFPEAIKQAMNMSIIFQQDLKQSVIQLGKALNDPIRGVGALRRIGVSFSETQKDQIRNFMAINDLASAQGVILEELAREMGGVSDRMHEAPLSDWQLGMMRLKDAGEGVGDALSTLLGPVRALWLGVSKLVEEFDKFDKWYTGRGTEKAANERIELTNDLRDSFRDQLRTMKGFVPGGTMSQAMANFKAYTLLYKEGNIETKEYTKNIQTTLDHVKKIAKEGGFVEPLTPEQIDENKKRLGKLSKFMEKFRSKNLEDEANFQIEKAIALDASLEHQQQIRDFYKGLEKEKLKAHYDELQAQLTAFGTQLLENKANQLNLEMNRDIEHTKNTRKYKRAQKRGDIAEMDRLEKEAAAKTYSRRLNNFRANQGLAVSNIVIDYLQGIAKETSKTGLFGLTTAGILMTAASTAAVGAVMAQKPPKFALGGDFVTQGPQNIMVGDNPGGRERVQVTPLSSPNIEGPQGETSVVVNVSGNVMTQDFVEDELAEAIKEAARRGTDFGIT